MTIPIKNASEITLDQNTGTLPDMVDAILSYFQPLVFTTIVKTVVNHTLVETPTDTTYMACIQPYAPQNVDQRPAGQRIWPWFQIHAEIALQLQPDDVITYQGVSYRVKSRQDFSLYGYMYYIITQNYT